jgi:phage terminase large subunit
MKLTKKQTKALDVLEDKITRELIFGGGAGGAKSALGCYWVTKCSLKYAGTRWVIGRETLKTLKETTLNTLFWVFSVQGLKPNIHYKYNEIKARITFFNGSEILLKELKYYPSDPNFDELGSLEITGAFVDECNQIVYKAWQVLQSRIRYKLDEYGLIPKILGTCNPAKGWVYSNFYLPAKNKLLQIGRAFIQSLINDNPFISKHYRDNLLALDKVSKERLLYGNWEYDDDPTVLCDYDAICDLFTNEHIKGDGKKYISSDLAMQGRDRFIIGPWDGFVLDLTKGIVKGKSTGKEIENDLKQVMIREGVPRSQTVVDSDGLGAYLESYLTGIKEFHGGSSAIDNVEYANLKSECGYKLAEMVNKRLMRIICDADTEELIKEELGVLKAETVTNDEKKKRIIKKDLMKELLGRSPDYLDLLIMRM